MKAQATCLDSANTILVNNCKYCIDEYDEETNKIKISGNWYRIKRFKCENLSVIKLRNRTIELINANRKLNEMEIKLQEKINTVNELQRDSKIDKMLNYIFMIGFCAIGVNFILNYFLN